MDLFVPEHAIDQEEVFSRGGRNFGDEDFALFKCPNCWQVYLIDRAADVVYVDPRNLGTRVSADRVREKCVGCGTAIDAEPFSGPAAPESVRVTWDQLRATRWAWVATIEVMLRSRKAMKQQNGSL